MQYLCYDIRGIQSFIFRIPKLKYIIGGSALIDCFDRYTIPSLAKELGVELLFAGGGKGTFYCDESKIQSVKSAILAKAGEIGIDIRFGQSSKYDEASKNANELYPFMPKSLNGKPCPVSGLYPVEDGKEHYIVKKRVFMKGEKMFRYYENELFKDVEWPADVAEFKDSEFFHNVKDSDDASDNNGKLGAAVLGKRNRWAVVCMDGNDMGSQMQYKIQELKDGKISEQDMPKWIQKMSSAIDNCSREATRQGIWAVLRAWKGSKDDNGKRGEGSVLPIRPIVVGGDDVSVLCHVSYAMIFVDTVMKVFNEVSKKTPEAWPATGGNITISAGVLYCSVSLPLHSAMGYAEALLASAKTRGRKVKKQAAVDANTPTPESVDWESITNSVITSPADYRQKNLLFMDESSNINKQICLTSRPCTWTEFKEIEKLSNSYKEIPATIRYRVLPAMSKSYGERLAFVAEILKNHPTLANDLAAPCDSGTYDSCFPKPSKWVELEVEGKKRLTTPVIDALSLLEEDSRMQKETV